MLKISIHEEAQIARFKLEGKLASEWVEEAAKAWQAFAAKARPREVVVDLCGVLYVDDAGRELLERIVRADVTLVGCGAMTNSLIEEITAKVNSRAASDRKTSAILSLLLWTLLAGSALFGYHSMSRVWSVMSFGQEVSLQPAGSSTR